MLNVSYQLLYHGPHATAVLRVCVCARARAQPPASAYTLITVRHHRAQAHSRGAAGSRRTRSRLSWRCPARSRAMTPGHVLYRMLDGASSDASSDDHVSADARDTSHCEGRGVRAEACGRDGLACSGPIRDAWPPHTRKVTCTQHAVYMHAVHVHLPCCHAMPCAKYVRH